MPLSQFLFKACPGVMESCPVLSYISHNPVHECGVTWWCNTQGTFRDLEHWAVMQFSGVLNLWKRFQMIPNSFQFIECLSHGFSFVQVWAQCHVFSTESPKPKITHWATNRHNVTTQTNVINNQRYLTTESTEAAFMRAESECWSTSL